MYLYNFQEIPKVIAEKLFSDHVYFSITQFKIFAYLRITQNQIKQLEQPYIFDRGKLEAAGSSQMPCGLFELSDLSRSLEVKSKLSGRTYSFINIKSHEIHCKIRNYIFFFLHAKIAEYNMSVKVKHQWSWE